MKDSIMLGVGDWQIDSKNKDHFITHFPFLTSMVCSMKNCGTTVQNALRGVPGVDNAIVSFEDGLAKVWAKPGHSLHSSDLIEAVEVVGFGAIEVGGHQTGRRELGLRSTALEREISEGSCTPGEKSMVFHFDMIRYVIVVSTSSSCGSGGGGCTLSTSLHHHQEAPISHLKMETNHHLLLLLLWLKVPDNSLVLLSRSSNQ